MDITKMIATIPAKSLEERRRMRENAERQLSSANSAMRENANLLTDALNAFEKAAQQEQMDRVSNLPEVERVKEAFRAVPPTTTDCKALLALLENPHKTSAQLSEICGWGGQIWHMHFANTGKIREVHLWPALPSEKRDANFWCGILADFDETNATWTMKSAVAEAVQDLQLTT